MDCGYPFVPREQKEGECIMAKSEQVIKDLDRVIGLINTDMKDIPAEEKKQMVADTIDHFDNYVSPGWLNTVNLFLLILNRAQFLSGRMKGLTAMG